MPRGRTRQPDAIKALKGNPRKERLDLRDDGQVGELIPPADDASASILRKEDYPALLTRKAEREVFRKIVEDFVPRRLARRSDFTAYARYSVFLCMWVKAKRTLGSQSTVYESKSKHGNLLRRHPAFQDMIDLDKVLSRAELQLGLTPLSRQTLIRGLSSLPAGALGGLFGDDRGKAKDDPVVEAPSTAPASPLGFLQTPAKLN